MLRSLIEIGAGFLVLILSQAPFLKQSSRSRDCSDFGKKGHFSFISVIVLFFIFAFLLFYKVTEIPTPWHVDEAGMAYDALSIAEYGVDCYLYKNPVYFINFGSGQNALYTYLAALCIKLLGYSVLAIRLPAIILSLAAFIMFVRMVHRELGETAALTAAVLFCILPFSIMHSRWALESYLLFPMTVISTSVFTEAAASGKTRLYIYSGILFGLTLYSYAIAYIFLAIFLLICLPYLLILKQIRWKQLPAMGIPLFLLALPLILMLAVNNGYLSEIRTPLLSIPKMLSYRSDSISPKQILSNLQPGRGNLFYIIFFNDGLMYNAVSKFGTLYYFSIPFILSGFFSGCKNAVKSMQGKRYAMDFIMTAVLLSALLTSLFITEPNINRVNEIYFPLIYFLCIGILRVIKSRKAAALLITGIYLVLSAGFIRYYFNDFQKVSDDSVYIASIKDLEEALVFAEEVRQDNRQVFVVGKNQPYIYTILALKTDPYTFDREKVTEQLDVTSFRHYSFLRYLLWDEIPTDIVYIFRDKKTIPQNVINMGFDTKDFNSIRVYYNSQQ